MLNFLEIFCLKHQKVKEIICLPMQKHGEIEIVYLGFIIFIVFTIQYLIGKWFINRLHTHA
jgi:hypothetical protein